MLMANHLTGFGSPSAGPVAGDPFWPYVVLMFQPTAADVSAGSYPTDAAGKAITYHGDAALSGASPIPGGGSVALSGTGYVNYGAAAAFSMGSSDFVVEAIASHSSAGTFFIVRPETSANTGFYHVESVGRVRFSTDNGANMAFQGGPADKPMNTFHHHAFVRSGGNFYYYIDGQQVYTATGVFGDNGGGAPTLQLGRAPASGNMFIGHIAAVRITKGADRGFTTSTIPVPTALWPAS